MSELQISELVVEVEQSPPWAGQVVEVDEDGTGQTIEVVGVGLQGPQGPAGQPVTSYPFTMLGELSVFPGVVRLPIPLKGNILSVIATVGTPPAGSAIVVEVLKNGQPVFVTAPRPTIPVGAMVSAEAIPDVTAVVVGDYLTVNVVQVGSATPGADLCVVVAVVHTEAA